MTQRPKTGGRASDNERRRAAGIVEFYREENPERGELLAEHAPARMIDDEFLIASLEQFARTGTFAGL